MLLAYCLLLFKSEDIPSNYVKNWRLDLAEFLVDQLNILIEEYFYFWHFLHLRFGLVTFCLLFILFYHICSF